MAAFTLAFRHDLDPSFTTAIDSQGRMYRVLLASGTTDSRYYLSPWDGTKRVTHRGMYVGSGHPLCSVVDAAERDRKALADSAPKPRQLTADTI